MSDDTKEDKDEEKEEEKKDDDDASLACAELLRLALLSKDLNTLNTTNQTRLSDGEVKQLQRGGEEFREILMNNTKNNNNTGRCSVIVLVFSMENCQPCAQFAPKIDRLAQEYKDLHVGFVKCNIHQSDMNRRLANEAGVFGFPCAQMYDGHTGQKVQLEGGDVKGANEAKLREGLETHAYNVEKFDRLKRDAFEALSEAKAKIFYGEDDDDDEQEQQQEEQQQRFVTLVKTVTAYASNAIEKEDAKYRRIKTSGKAFTERVKSVGDEGEKCLRAFGFEKKKGDDDDEEVYEISPVVFDEFDENNKFGKREMRRVIKMLRALTG
jgi:thiol-disulfide isomerase/thioredoxin